MRSCNQVKSLHIPEVLAAVTSHQTQSLHGGLNLHHQCLNGSHKLHGKIHAVVIFFPRMVEWSSTACLQFPLTYFLHIWPISEKLSNTDCFPHFLHIWPIFGNSATLTVFSFFSHSFSICGKYLEMGQKLINSRLDPEPPTLQAHVCHLSQFCTRVQLGLLFFTLQAAQVHIFQLNNEESVMGNNIPMSQTC